MLVKVIKCKCDDYWYYSNIGEVFEVENRDNLGRFFLKVDLIKQELDKNWPLRYFTDEDIIEFNRYEKLTKIIDRIKYENS